MDHASAIDLSRTPAELPLAFAAAPAWPGQERSILRVAVVVRREGDPGARFVVLRELIDGRVLLGCLIDAAGRVHRWLEIWVQDVEGLGALGASWPEAVNNRTLDERWSARARAFEAIGPEGLIRTGWEDQPPAPVVLDASTLAPRHPVEERSGKPWRLCRDEGFLAAKGLAAYGASLARYLHVPELGADSPVAVASGAEAAGEVLAREAAMGGSALPLNPGGGLLLVRPACSMSFEAYADALTAGSGWPAPPTEADGWMLAARQGSAARLLETFYLKLRAIADAVEAVREVTRALQAPLLNVRAESFGVRLAAPAAGLPVLWTARTLLLDPGQAVALPVKSADAAYFLPGRPPKPSVYAMAVTGRGASGRGTVRVRRIVAESGGATIVEATLSAQERFSAGVKDLVWLRLSVGGVRLDLHATVQADAALASGELRLRTLPLRLPEASLAALRGVEGVTLPDTPFEAIPLLSTPCDLHALAVLAVRTLLVGAEAPLPVAVDETLSLAAQVAADHNPDVALPRRVRAIVEGDERWLASLGPHRLVDPPMEAGAARAALPMELWCEALAAIVRMFPGVGPDSVCRDAGDAPAGGLHRVFDPAMADLRGLLRRARSLIVGDAASNREIRSVLRAYAESRAEPGRAPAAAAR